MTKNAIAATSPTGYETKAQIADQKLSKNQIKVKNIPANAISHSFNGFIHTSFLGDYICMKTW